MRFLKKMFFFVFLCCCKRDQKKTKWKKAKNIKIVFFKVGIQKMRKMTKRIFSKNHLTPFVSGREKKREFSCTLSVLHTFWGAQNSENPGKIIEMVVSAEIAQNLK